MNHAAARTVSILGHPMLVLPLAATGLATARGQWRMAGWMVLGFAVFAAVVMAYSRWQVGRGRWAHVDASGRSERRSLNRFLLVALLLATLLAAGLGQSRELMLGLGLSTALVAFAMLTARWWKLSLHMAFVVYAALLLFATAWWIGMIGIVFAALVAWSRLALGRHVPRDLVAGGAAGALAGFAYLSASSGWTG